MESFKEYYIAPKIKKQLIKGMKIIEKADQDMVFTVTGREGSGKSLLAMQLAYFIDDKFSLDDIAFTSTQFSELVKKTKKKVVVFDEAFFA